MPQRILIVEPHPITREGLKKIISQYTDFEICPDFVTREECFAALQKYRPEFIVYEPAIRKTDSAELLKEIQERDKAAKIIIFTVNNTAEQALQYLDMGVNAYLTKTCSAEEFVKALVQITKRNRYIQESLLIRLRSESNARNIDRAKLRYLTPREKDILVLVSKGLLNKEIATSLNISERTVKNHMSNIFKKIEVSDRTQAAVFAIKNNLVKV